MTGVWTLIATGSGCSDSTTITVVAGTAPISGLPTVCQGLTVSLSDPTSGGTWSSSDPSLATVDASGIVTGVSPGTGTISYTAPGGCANTVPFNITAVAGTVTGPSLVCSMSSGTYTDATSGGAWSVGFAAIATISTGGILTPVATGTTTVVYTLPGGCSSSMVVTISPTPTPMTITPNPVCIGSTCIVTDAASGGAWSSSNLAVASITGGGLLTSSTTGTANVTYALGTGCATISVVTVNTTPGAILGTPIVCVGGTTLLTDVAAGGTWTSTTPGVATLGITSGIASGITAGTATVSYFLSTGCWSTIIVTVNPLPSAFAGPTSMCVGGYDTLTISPSGGTWSTIATTVFIVDSPGVLYGVSAGIGNISYTTPAGCATDMTVTVVSTVAAISGPSNVCDASFITLTDATIGGTWSSSVPGVLKITGATGVATGVAAGSATVTYSLASGCLSSMVVTVDASPAAPVVSGTSFYCPCVTFVPFTVVPSTGILWYASATGGTGFATAPVINTCVSGVTTNWASETAGGCESPRASFAVTVDVTPVVTASGSSNCGGTFTVNAGGAGTGGTYLWSPSTGLSCPGCATATATISSTTTYTVTGTDAGGCSGTNTVTLTADRISGYIGMTAAPTDTVKVWLIQFNTTDSSLIAQDSTLSCMDSGTPYYEFDSKPAGNYMVKAKLLSSVPGTSGYVPT